MSKERMANLAQQVRDNAGRGDPVAIAAIELVKLCGDAAKESLVDAVGDDMLRLQGSARDMRKLHKELTTAPPSIAPQETK